MGKSENAETGHRFNDTLLACYRELLQNTNLQKAYQEWFRWFRFLRNELEKRMPDYKFQTAVAENGMEYAYFQFTSISLKENGLKMVVVFLHEQFSLELWLSGINRKTQVIWREKLSSEAISFSRTTDPMHTDYYSARSGPGGLDRREYSRGCHRTVGRAFDGRSSDFSVNLGCNISIGNCSFDASWKCRGLWPLFLADPF